MSAAGLSCVDSIPGRSKWRSLLPHGRGEASTHRMRRLKYDIRKIQNKKISTCDNDLFQGVFYRQIQALNYCKAELENMKGVLSKASEKLEKRKLAAPSRWRCLIPGFVKSKKKIDQKEKRLNKKKEDIDQMLGSVEKTQALQGRLYADMGKHTGKTAALKYKSKTAVIDCWDLSGPERLSFMSALNGLTQEDIGAAYDMASEIKAEMESARETGQGQRDWSSIEYLVGGGKPYKKKSSAEKKAYNALSKLAIITGASPAQCGNSIADTLEFMVKQMGYDGSVGNSNDVAYAGFFRAYRQENKELNKKLESTLSDYKKEAVEETLALQERLGAGMQKHNQEIAVLQSESKTAVIDCWDLSGPERLNFMGALDGLTQEDIEAAYDMAVEIAAEIAMKSARETGQGQRDWSSIEYSVGGGKPYKKKNSAEKKAYNALSKLAIITGAGPAQCGNSIADTLEFMVKQMGYDGPVGNSNDVAYKGFFHAYRQENKELNKKFESTLSDYKKEEAVAKDSESLYQDGNLREDAIFGNTLMASDRNHPTIKDRLDDEMSSSVDDDLYYSADDDISSSDEEEEHLAQQLAANLKAADEEEEHLGQQLADGLKASDEEEEHLAQQLAANLKAADEEEEHLGQQLADGLKAADENAVSIRDEFDAACAMLDEEMRSVENTLAAHAMIDEEVRSLDELIKKMDRELSV